MDGMSQFFPTPGCSFSRLEACALWYRNLVQSMRCRWESDWISRRAEQTMSVCKDQSNCNLRISVVNENWPYFLWLCVSIEKTQPLACMLLQSKKTESIFCQHRGTKMSLLPESHSTSEAEVTSCWTSARLVLNGNIWARENIS